MDFWQPLCVSLVVFWALVDFWQPLCVSLVVFWVLMDFWQPLWVSSVVFWTLSSLTDFFLAEVLKGVFYSYYFHIVMLLEKENNLC